MKQRTTPCPGCPFRKKSLRGWLGPHQSTVEITGRLRVGIKFPCHEEVNKLVGEKMGTARRDKRAEQRAVDEAVKEATHCVGALQMMNNSCAVSRNRVTADLQEQVGESDKVFSDDAEMAAWHDDPHFAEARARLLKGG